MSSRRDACDFYEGTPGIPDPLRDAGAMAGSGGIAATCANGMASANLSGRECAKERFPMLRKMAICGVLGLAVITAPPAAQAQAGSETFTATASVKTAGKTAPVTIVIDRKMPQSEADKFLAAFKAGGAEALRKALVGVPPTGTVTIGTSKPTPTRLTLERRTGSGRLITIVADQALRFLGSDAPGAKPKEGYDFAVIDLTVDD